MRRLEDGAGDVRAHSTEQSAKATSAMQNEMAEVVEALSRHSTEVTQQLQVLDAKHESLEHTLGIRFDTRLMVSLVG